jgi:hypothetical protein
MLLPAEGVQFVYGRLLVLSVETACVLLFQPCKVISDQVHFCLIETTEKITSIIVSNIIVQVETDVTLNSIITV